MRHCSKDKQQSKKREEYIQYVSDRAEQAGHTALVPRHLNLASEFAIANLFYYFTLHQEGAT